MEWILFNMFGACVINETISTKMDVKIGTSGVLVLDLVCIEMVAVLAVVVLLFLVPAFFLLLKTYLVKEHDFSCFLFT